MAAPSIVQAVLNTATFTSTPTPGNLAFLWTRSYTDVGDQPVTSNGWALISQCRGAFNLWWRVVLPGDTGAYPGAATSGSFAGYITIEVAGADPDWLQTIDVLDIDSETTGVMPNADTITADTLALAWSGQTFGPGAQALSSPWSAVIGGAGGFTENHLYEQTVSTPGTTLSGTWTNWGTGAFAQSFALMLLRPAPAAWTGPTVVQTAQGTSPWGPPVLPGAPTPGNIMLCYSTNRDAQSDGNQNGWTMAGRTGSSAAADAQVSWRIVQGGDTAGGYANPYSAEGSVSSYELVEVAGADSTWAASLDGIEIEALADAVQATPIVTSQADVLVLMYGGCTGDGGDSFVPLGAQDTGNWIDDRFSNFCRTTLLQKRVRDSGYSTAPSWRSQNFASVTNSIILAFKGPGGGGGDVVGNYVPGSVGISAAEFEGVAETDADYSPGAVTISAPSFEPMVPGGGSYTPGSLAISAPEFGTGPGAGHYDLGSLSISAPDFEVTLSAVGHYSPGGVTIAAPSFLGPAQGRVTELDVAVLSDPVGSTFAQATEVDVAIVGTAGGSTFAQVMELDAAVVARPVSLTDGGIAELDVAVLGFRGPNATKRAMVWKITRKDGEIFAFTSHDRPLIWGSAETEYKPCKSLSATASESASELNSVGSVEIDGILDDASITAADLYAGLFDDAFVDIWVIPWDGLPDDQAPFRVAAGFTGKVTRKEWAFTAEILGPGARLQQASLVEFFTPGCRFDFGVLDANGIGCPVNAEALKIAGLVVTRQAARTLVYFTHADPGGSIWNGGKVRWLTGRNAGIVCQTDTVDFAAGALSLWDLAPYPPAIGDTFDLLPGCPKTKHACKDIYNVFISYGGFMDVPGPDSLQSNADSLFTGN